MHEILIILLVLVAGIFIGHDLWPSSKNTATPAATARGKLPATPEQSGIDVRGSELVTHGRVHPGDLNESLPPPVPQSDDTPRVSPDPQ
jgi:hypothetical protein